MTTTFFANPAMYLTNFEDRNIEAILVTLVMFFLDLLETAHLIVHGMYHRTVKFSLSLSDFGIGPTDHIVTSDELDYGLGPCLAYKT